MIFLKMKCLSLSELKNTYFINYDCVIVEVKYMDSGARM